MMRILQLLKQSLLLAVVAGLGIAGYFTSDHWLPLLQHKGHDKQASEPVVETASETATPPTKIIVVEQAQKNLGLTFKAILPETFWKTITVPGMVVDRPGISDREIVAPVTGVVSAIHHVPGDTVRPGDPLFTLKLLSESLHLTQTDLFKTTQDIKLALAQKLRLAAVSGAIPESRIFEVDSQITRLQVAAKAYRQELLNRGLTSEDIDGVAEGKFVGEMAVVAPERMSGHKPLIVAIAT
jgi:multidrug efflux pump subunit AcrA (membrane-fusion protein)